MASITAHQIELLHAYMNDYSILCIQLDNIHEGIKLIDRFFNCDLNWMLNFNYLTTVEM